MKFLGNDAKQREKRTKPSPDTRCKGKKYRKLRMHRQARSMHSPRCACCQRQACHLCNKKLVNEETLIVLWWSLRYFTSLSQMMPQIRYKCKAHATQSLKQKKPASQGLDCGKMQSMLTIRYQVLQIEFCFVFSIYS